MAWKPLGKTNVAQQRAVITTSTVEASVVVIRHLACLAERWRHGSQIIPVSIGWFVRDIQHACLHSLQRLWAQTSSTHWCSNSDVGLKEGSYSAPGSWRRRRATQISESWYLLVTFIPSHHYTQPLGEPNRPDQTVEDPLDQTVHPVVPVLVNDDGDETAAPAKGVKREHLAPAREVKREREREKDRGPCKGSERERTEAPAREVKKREDSSLCLCSSPCQRTSTREKPMSPSQRRRTMSYAMTKRCQSNAKAKAKSTPRVKAKTKQLGTRVTSTTNLLDFFYR